MTVLNMSMVKVENRKGETVSAKNIDFGCDYCGYEFTRIIRKGSSVECPRCNNFLKSGWKE